MIIDNGLVNVAVFFGGDSVEHEVSIISAVQAMTHLNREKYNVIPVYLSKSGIMYTSAAMFEIDSFRKMDELIAKSRVVEIANNGQGVILTTNKKNDFSGKKPIKLDVALPVVHGTNCEDGSLQGYFETLRLPYVGCDVLASSVGMDKAIFKSVLRTAGIPVLDCIRFSSNDYSEFSKNILQRIDDVIIMNGHKIYPSEVAEQIHKSAEIDECVVMLNFDLIKKSIEYTSNLFKTKRVIYSITCNGSILSNEHIEFFEKNNVDLLISLDGPKEIQNKNRKFAANGYGTYDVVSMNVKNIISKHNNYFKEHVRFNPVILNKDDQIDVYNYFTNNLNLPTEKFAPSIANLSGTDYFAHIIAKDNAKDIFRNRSLETTQNSLKEHNNVGSIYCHGGPCIPGFSKLMVSTDGDFYPCEKVNEKNNVYKIGNILSGFNKTRLIGFFDMVKLSEEQCKKCWQIRLCHICPMECGVVEGNGYSFEQKRIKCDAQSNLLISHFKKIVLNKGGKECRDI